MLLQSSLLMVRVEGAEEAGWAHAGIVENSRKGIKVRKNLKKRL